MLKRPSTLIVLLLLFSACEKEVTTPSYSDKPVIEGYLYADKYAQIKISRQIASSENVVYADNNIDSLDILIYDSDSSYKLMPVGGGIYENTGLIIKEGKQYTIKFNYNNTEVRAVTTVPAIPQNFTQSVKELSVQKIDSNFMPTPGSFTINDPVELDWSNSDNSYYMILVKNTETSPELIRDTTNAMFRTTSFRNEPSIINEYQLRDQQFQYFGTHMLLLYHLNPDYAALYSDNSNSSQNLTNPTTNITNGLGIFTGISSDTLYLKVKKK